MSNIVGTIILALVGYAVFLAVMHPLVTIGLLAAMILLF